LLQMVFIQICVVGSEKPMCNHFQFLFSQPLLVMLGHSQSDLCYCLSR